jgi:4-amino-4-deoxy-L-arabinose transferase-like glycosyltransferase
MSLSRPTVRVDVALILILLFGTLLRLQYVQLPMAEAHRWRAVTNADVARNFAERSMNIFYPQVNWGGADAPYVGMEFPLMQWIVALGYLIFGEHEILGRLVSIAFSVGTIWAVFALGARLFGVAVGRAAAFLMAVSPTAVFFGRILISDTPMLFFSVVAVLAWVVYLETGATRAAVAGATAAALAFLVKIPAVMILAPIGWAAWEARRWSALKDRRLMLGLAGALAAAVAWYWHADLIFHRSGLGQAIWHPSGTYALPIAISAGPFDGVYHWSTLNALRDPNFYYEMVSRTWVLHLTPAGLILSLFALLAMWHVSRRHIADVWLGTVVLFILVAAEGNRNHEFHQLPLLPPAALLFGLAAAPAFDGTWLRTTGRCRLRILGAGVAIVLAGWLSFHRSGVIPGFFRPDSLDDGPIRSGRAIERAVEPGALVVTVEYGKFGSNSPILLYWAHRRGWSFDFGAITPFVVERLRTGFGAAYFATTVWPELAKTHPALADYLRTRRQIPLMDAPRDTALFDLTTAADTPGPVWVPGNTP